MPTPPRLLATLLAPGRRLLHPLPLLAIATHNPLPTAGTHRHQPHLSHPTMLPTPTSGPRRSATPSPRPPSQSPRSLPAAPSQPQPLSPTRQKNRPSYLSPARTPAGGSRWREIAPPSPPSSSGCRTLAQASPLRPGATSPTGAPLRAHAPPRSVRRRPWPPTSPEQPKNAPPQLKSFLEKTLTRANPPHFTPPGALPSLVRSPQPPPAPPQRTARNIK